MQRRAPEITAAAEYVKPAFEPIVHNRPSRTRSGPIRVVAFNASGGVRFGGIAACLARHPLNRAAIILLCESDWGTGRVGGREIAAELAMLLDMSFAYVPEFGIRRANGGLSSFLGNAILSTEPFDEVRAVAMPDPHPGRHGWARHSRVGTHAGLVVSAIFAGTPITIGVAHLHSRSSPQWRERQMATYLAQFPPSGPAIFGGDLNTTTTELPGPGAMIRTAARMLANPHRFRSPQSHEPLFQRLAEHGLEIHGANVMNKPTFTFTRLIPPRLRPKLDWIAVRGVQPVRRSAAVIPARTSIFAPRVSDHDFITVEIDL